MDQTNTPPTPETAPTDRPLRQSPVDMSWDGWRALLDRYLAGEPIGALAAEAGVSASSIHRNAKKFGMRKKDLKRAVCLPKGPPPVVVTRDGRALTVACGALSFDFDPEDPVATERSILTRFGEAAVTGEARHGAHLGRMVFTVRRIFGGGPLFGAGFGVRFGSGVAADDNEPVAGPVALRPAQRAPSLLPDGSDWSTWLFLGGRGAGKTLAGASWLADQAALLGAGGRLALVGPTLHDVREVMIEGPSGLRSLPRWTRATRPVYEPSRRRLVFANGCIAQAFSAEDPDSLRGPQFSGAWADEFCAWPAVGARGAGETLALLRMGLRLPLVSTSAEAPSTAFGGPPPPMGEDCEAGAGSVLPPRGRGTPRSGVEGAGGAPKLVVTTTPRPTRALIGLRDEPSCALTHAGTAENVAHLSPGFLDRLRDLYGGTRREAQEIEGRIVDLAGALFTAEMMALARGWGLGSGEWGPAELAASPETSLQPPIPSPQTLDRIIVALDPTTTVTGDACGIIVAGSRRRADGVREAVVLADRSAHGLSPDQWARRAVEAAREFNAGAVVAEVNQGGDMVRAVLKTAGCTLRIREVRATRGKRIRAEPVAALYEQGRVRHAPADGVPFSALEEELMAVGGELEGAGSLDRADALVWAVTDLLIDAPEGERGPRIRRL